VTTTGYQLEVVCTDGTRLELMENDWGLYRFDVAGADATFGNPVPVSEVIASLMSDGSLSSLTGFGNRQAVFTVMVKAPDTDQLNAAEAALMSALDKGVALAWTAPWGAVSYFDIVACWSEHLPDDLAEVMQGTWAFRVTFECLPFARSADPVTFAYNPGDGELDPLTSMSGWTTVSGSAAYNSNAGGLGVPGILAGGSGAVLRKTFTVDSYLWFKTPGIPPSAKGITSVKVNGTAIPDAQVREEGNLVITATRFYTVDVSAWRGQSVTVEFALLGSTALTELWTRSYPGAIAGSSDASPKGITVIDVIGTARTPCTISFTAPAGGAFVYTGPDPDAAIRSRGVGEAVYGKFTVTGDGGEVSVGGHLMWFPPGSHTTSIGSTSSQPLELNPNGVWPQATSGAGLSGTNVSSGSQWAYPMDPKAAVSFFTTTGAKTLISPSPSLPQGYYADAVTHEQHTLHPGRSGFAVLDASGYPVTATVTYYPRWKHHAAQ
jgi:hypothetical protein